MRVRAPGAESRSEARPLFARLRVERQVFAVAFPHGDKMIRGIHHTSISTQDFERLVAFYRDVVGLELVASYGWDRTSPDAENLDKSVGRKGSSTQSALVRAVSTDLEIFRYVPPAGKHPIPDRPACD